MTEQEPNLAPNSEQKLDEQNQGAEQTHEQNAAMAGETQRPAYEIMSLGDLVMEAAQAREDKDPSEAEIRAAAAQVFMNQFDAAVEEAAKKLKKPSYLSAGYVYERYVAKTDAEAAQAAAEALKEAEAVAAQEAADAAEALAAKQVADAAAQATGDSTPKDEDEPAVAVTPTPKPVPTPKSAPMPTAAPSVVPPASVATSVAGSAAVPQATAGDTVAAGAESDANSTEKQSGSKRFASWWANKKEMFGPSMGTHYSNPQDRAINAGVTETMTPAEIATKKKRNRTAFLLGVSLLAVVAIPSIGIINSLASGDSRAAPVASSLPAVPDQGMVEALIGNTGEKAIPVTNPETPVGDPSFNVPDGSGGEALFNRLNIDTAKWYDNDQQFLAKNPTDFYPMADGNVGLSHPGFLSQNAQNDINSVR